MELSELYSYSEESELQSGAEKLTKLLGPLQWKAGCEVSVVRRLLGAAESANPIVRNDAVGALLYVAQVDFLIVLQRRRCWIS